MLYKGLRRVCCKKYYLHGQIFVNSRINAGRTKMASTFPPNANYFQPASTFPLFDRG